MVDDNNYDTAKTNYCPSFDGMHASLKKWWIGVEIYAITNGTLSSDEKKKKAEMKALLRSKLVFGSLVKAC